MRLSGQIVGVLAGLRSVFGRFFRGSWVQTSGSDQFVTVVRRAVWRSVQSSEVLSLLLLSAAGCGGYLVVGSALSVLYPF